MTHRLTNSPIRIAWVHGAKRVTPGNVYLQVTTGTARISKDQQTLVEASGGLSITSASGIVRFEWLGDMWASGDAEINVEIV